MQASTIWQHTTREPAPPPCASALPQTLRIGFILNQSKTKQAIHLNDGRHDLQAAVADHQLLQPGQRAAALGERVCQRVFK